MDTIGERIKIERKRLGQKQEAICEAVGISRGAQSNYENGKRSPDTEYLMALDRMGFDIGYVITGRRSVTLDDLVELQRCLFEVEDWLERHQKTLNKEQKLNAAKQLFAAKQKSIASEQATELILKTAVGF